MIPALARLLDPAGTSWLRLFHAYLSTRTGFAFVTSLLIVLLTMPLLIRLCSALGLVNRQRDFIANTSSKEGTPAMGGVLIFLGSTLSMLLWGSLTNPFLLAVLGGGVWFFLLGAYDDYMKAKYGDADRGISRPGKLVAQGLFAVVLVYWLLSDASPHPELLKETISVPFFKQPFFIGTLWTLFAVLFIVFVSNSVNLADGMDGLATGPCFMTFLGVGVFAYILGDAIWSHDLLYFYIDKNTTVFLPCREVALASASVMGALMGFLWYNTYPAQIFMGDSGSLFLGGVMATCFVLIRQEMLYIIFGFLFLIEGASVMLQDIGVKVAGRRLLFRAPFHDLLRHIGWSEPKIVVRLWIVSGFLLIVGLLTLKLR